MSAKDAVFVLGAIDPEMFFIRKMLLETGSKWVIAMNAERRCHSSNAYSSDGYSMDVLNDSQRVWVECRSDDFDAGRDLIVDHHHEGDPGYSAPPSEFWAGSSIGQTAQLVGGSYEKYKLAAASDHCLSAAMRGECAGINPTELMSWRIEVRAMMRKIPTWLMRDRLARAERYLATLPRIMIAGQTVVDASFIKVPELRDAAALAKVPVLITKLTQLQEVRIGLYGAPKDVTAEWLSSMDDSSYVSRTYGNPHREYSCAVLTPSVSEHMRVANGY